MTGHLVAEEMLEAAQVGAKALGELVAESGWDRGVAGGALAGWSGTGPARRAGRAAIADGA